jgi:hypothetical protein
MISTAPEYNFNDSSTAAEFTGRTPKSDFVLFSASNPLISLRKSADLVSLQYATYVKVPETCQLGWKHREASAVRAVCLSRQN